MCRLIEMNILFSAQSVMTMAFITFDETSHPISFWQLLNRLLQGNLHAEEKSIWRQPVYRCKFFARALLHPALTINWLHYIAQHPRREQMLQAQMALPDKLQRPYLSVRFRPRQTLAALRFHYDAVEHASPLLRSTLLSPGGIPIIHLQGKCGADYTVMLGALSALDKEGEMTLLFYAGEVALARLTMTLMHIKGQTTLFIGGLQGPGRHLEQQREHIQQVTRDCHGLFPKRIVMEAASCLAEILGATQLMAVGNDTHIYKSWRYWRKKKTQFHADYEGYWLSLGATVQADGHCVLPLRLARKPLEEVASKKRAEYQRANRLLADVQQQMQQLIAR